MPEIVLSRPLILEAAIRQSDGAGGFEEIWMTLGILWADVRARNGREVAGVDVTLSKVSYRITVRGAPQGAPSRPSAGQRFRDGTRYFMIRAVTEAGPRGKYLTCFADEEVTA